jgi:hypothetical protein
MWNYVIKVCSVVGMTACVGMNMELHAALLDVTNASLRQF